MMLLATGEEASSTDAKGLLGEMRSVNVKLCRQACEMFILELTLRSWNHSEENKRRTLQRNDIAAAITRTDIFDFLVCATSSMLHS